MNDIRIKCTALHLAIGAAAILAVATSLTVNGQARVDTKVDNRVHKQSYGNEGNGSIRYGYQQSVMPSEYRYQALRSGALPSEIKAQQNAVGPLAPGGRSSYIPGVQPLAGRKPEPVPSEELNMGSIRYNGVPQTWTAPSTSPSPIGSD